MNLRTTLLGAAAALLLPLLPVPHADAAEGIGEVKLEVSCSPEAQRQFNRALAKLHSFWFGPAGKGFAEVAATDPGCAMAHWGRAVTLLGNPLAAPPSTEALEEGWAAVQQAVAADAKTPRERGYIAAIETFYRDHDKLDHRARTLAYEKAMEKLAADYPEDSEATIFYALALNMTALPTDKTYANQLKAAELLETVFAAQPSHPGVAHYLIHSYDYPPIAKHGLPAAERYAAIAPAAPHAQHMPSHIFTRLGKWQESIASNRASAEIATKEVAAGKPGLASANALHAMDYMVYAHLQRADDAEAKRVLDYVAGIEKVDAVQLSSGYALAAMPARYALERQQWREAASLVPHPKSFAWDKLPQAEAVTHFARAYGAARSGDVANANQSIERLTQLQEKLVAAKQSYWAGQTDIQIKVARAWVAFAEKRHGEALGLMRAAADDEDATEKHIVTPGPIVPARELLGEMLLELGDGKQALDAFAASHKVEPNRFHGLAGAARAAEMAGDQEKAKAYYGQLVALAADPDGDRAALRRAKELLAQR